MRGWPDLALQWSFAMLTSISAQKPPVPLRDIAGWQPDTRRLMTQTPSPPFEQQKWLHEMKREDAYRASDRLNSLMDTLNQAAVKSAEATLRAGILINGGAAVSVLAFMGSLASKNSLIVPQLSRVAGSLEVFAWGVAFAVAGLGLSYLTHFFEANYVSSLERNTEFPFDQPGPSSRGIRRLRHCAHILAVVSFLICIGCFVGGMISVRSAVEHFGH